MVREGRREEVRVAKLCVCDCDGDERQVKCVLRMDAGKEREKQTKENEERRKGITKEKRITENIRKNTMRERIIIRKEAMVRDGRYLKKEKIERRVKDK